MSADAGFQTYNDKETNMTSTDGTYQALCAELLTELNSSGLVNYTAGRYRHRAEMVEVAVSAIQAIMAHDAEVEA